MSVFDRVGKVVRAEWNARRPRFGAARTDEHGAPERQAPLPGGGGAPLRKPAVVDVDGALRVLELSAGATLDEVRAQHARLARRYHPKTLATNSDEAHAARVVLEALTDALELLEEHLLPLPPEPTATEPGGS
ncbi:MAG: J domain-containing protein [Deltaproteobacteria bacterium]|nr:J domain-containing protein [Deltaproteobacteria bacterium]